MARGCYVYAILAREIRPPAGLVGFGGARLSSVPWHDLAAAVSSLDSGELRPTADHVLRHEAVVEGLRQVGPALPVRFGTVLADADAVARALAQRYDVLAKDLARLGDKLEFGLSVLWNQPRVNDGLSGEGEDGSPTAGPVLGQGPGARYLQARLVKHRREAAARANAQALARYLDTVLACLALERRWTVLPTPRLALRGAYLLDPPQVPAFQEGFNKIRRERPDMYFLLSGPWPPYSFVAPTEIGEWSAMRGRLHEVAGQLSKEWPNAPSE
jgi:Gas vesicle synthesis protein GvpL/GvpF